MASFASYDRRRLTRSPLINVIWQVRFSSDVDLSDGRPALALQKAISRDLTLSQVEGEPSPAVRMAVGASVQEVSHGQTSGWKLAATDGSVVVTLARGVLTIETSRYESWDQVFFPWVAEALAALEAVMRPGLMTRMGVRYVNAIFGPTLEMEPFQSVDDIRAFVNPSLLGLTSVSDIGEVDVVQGRQVITHEATNVIVNHALVQSDDAQTGILIDVDVFDDGVVQFAQPDARGIASGLHDIAVAVFQRTITAEALMAMGPKEGSE